MLRWQDHFRPLLEAADGLETGALTRFLDTNSFYRAPKRDDRDAEAGRAARRALRRAAAGAAAGHAAFAVRARQRHGRDAEDDGRGRAQAADRRAGRRARRPGRAVPGARGARRASTTSPRRSRPSRAARSSRSGSPSATRGRCSSRALADLPVDGIGIDFYATHLADVPGGLSEAAPRRRRRRAQLAARGAARDRGLRAAPRRARGANRARSERRPPVRLRADRAREAGAPRQGQDRDNGGRSMSDDIKFLTHEIGSLAKPSVAGQERARPRAARRERHRARAHVGREGRRRRATRSSSSCCRQGERRPRRDRALVEPLLRAPAGVGRRRGDLGRRAAAQRDVRLGDRAREGLRAARHRPQLRQQVLHQVRRGRPRLAGDAVPQRRVLVPPVGREASS